MPSRFFNNRLLDFAETQGAMTAPETAFTLLDTELRALGAKGAVYGILPIGQDDSALAAPMPPQKGQAKNQLTEAHTFFSYPEEYAHAYMMDELINHDPFARFCVMANSGTLGWHDPSARRYCTEKSNDVLSMAAEFGLQHGMSVPLSNGSGLSVGGLGVALDANNARESEELMRAHGADIELAAMLFHARFHDDLFPQDVISLSQREVECLKWASVGLLTKEIAFKLSLSEKTVEFHLRNASKRLNARNRTHAVARALVYGLITI